jgi:hypothetical protein
MTKTQEDAIRNLAKNGVWHTVTSVSHDMICLSNDEISAMFNLQELVDLAAKGLEPTELTEAQQIEIKLGEWLGQYWQPLSHGHNASITIETGSDLSNKIMQLYTLTKPAPTLAERAAEIRKMLNEPYPRKAIPQDKMNDFLDDVIAAEAAKTKA